MSDLEQLTRLIEGILSGSNETRNQNEAILKTLRETEPNNYIMTFTNLLNVSPHKEVRIFCAVHLRRNLSSFVDATEQSCWGKLNSENQKALKELLWQILNKEDNPTARKALRELVGELAASVINMKMEDENGELPAEAKTWENLMSNIWGLLSSNNTDLIQNALSILSILFTFCMNEYEQYKEELDGVFKETLQHSDPKVKAAAIDAFASFLKTADLKVGKYFTHLIPLLLQNTMAAIEKDENTGAEALSHITDIIDGEPKLFIKNFRDLFDLLKAILQRDVSQPLKEGALESLTLFCEKVHKFVSKQPAEVIKEIFETVFRFMVIYTEEVTNEWLVPPEGFSENNEETDSQDYAVKFCMGLVDRLIVGLGEKLVLPILSGLLIEMMETNDWRYRFAALMALSQVGEYVEDIKELDPIVKFVMNFTQSDHPKVRYAALHAIGQIADNKEPEFQDRYLDEIFPSIISMLNDSVPHVVAHCLAAIINLIQKASVETGMKYVNQLWEPLLTLVQKGISLVREGAMGALACLIAACEAEFIPYWERTADIVYDTLKNATKKEYKKLRGQAIETLTVIGLCIGKEPFIKVAHNVIETMMDIQQNHIEDIDPQKSYLLLGWERMCSVMGEDFLPYVEKIVPPILDIVTHIIQTEVKNENSAEKKEEKEVMGLLAAEGKDPRSLFYQVNTSESEEAEIAVNLIKVLVYQIKEHYLPYLEKTSEILTFLIEKSQNEDLRIAAADALAGLILAVKESKLSDKDDIVKKISNQYLGILWESVKTEFEHADDISKLINSIKKVVLASGRYMNENEINQFNDNIFKVLKDSDTRKGINYFLLDMNQKTAEENQKAGGEENDEDFDDEEVEYLEEENDKEEKLHCSIAELMGAMFITYKELTLPLAQVVSQNIIPQVLNPTLSVYMNNFGLLLVNFMLESLGDLIQGELQALTEILVKYVVDKHAQLRETAARGIKILAEVAKDNFQAISGYCINALEEALKIQKQKEEKQVNFKIARDNIVGALGQIVKSQLHCVDQKRVVQIWLNNLPIKNDEVLARIQHELLVDLVLEVNATLVFGDKGENLVHVIQVFAEVLGTRLSSAKFEEKIGKIFQLLTHNENTKSMVQEAVRGLDKGLQEKLSKAVKEE